MTMTTVTTYYTVKQLPMTIDITYHTVKQSPMTTIIIYYTGFSFQTGCRRHSTSTLYSAAGYFLCIKDKKCVIP
jgi:hypothetical protein